MKLAFRQLLKHPVANGVILLTIALLIGAVSVIYASLQNQRAQYQPFPEHERVVKLWREGEKRIDQLFPAGVFVEYADRLSSFESVGALDWRQGMTLTELGEPVSYNTVGVSASLLRMSGVAPIQGRLFVESDEERGGGEALIISEQMWREKLEADMDVVGRELRLNDRLYTVVGVLPESMRNTRLSFNTDLWVPVRFAPDRRGVSLRLFGRLKPDVTLDQAQGELNAIAPAVERTYSPDENERKVYPGGFSGARVAALHEQLNQFQEGVPAEVALVWIFAGVIIGSVVGIACFNVANLLLARVSVRAREFSIRQCLGAGSWRVARQVVGETLLISAMGGVLGLAVSFWFFDLLRFQNVDARFDWRLYAIATGGTLLLAVLASILPAMQSAKINVNESLKDGGQTIGGRRRHRLRNFLVSAEVAMALILCVVAGLMTRAFVGLRMEGLGFEPKKTFAIEVDLRDGAYPEAGDRRAYVDRALRMIRAMPGVEAAGVSMASSMFNFTLRNQFTFAGREGREDRPAEAVTVYGGSESAGLEGMRLIAGRDLSRDPNRAASEALVNQTFTDLYCDGVSPIGRRLRISNNEQATIVGVVNDRHPLTTSRSTGPEAVLGFHATELTAAHVFTVRTSAEAKAMAGPVRETLQRLDAAQPVNQPIFIADLIERRLADARSGMLSLGGMAGAGLLIALMGVYGVVAYSVEERTREVGLRMAMGASRSSVLRMMLWQGGRLLMIGAIFGMAIGVIVLLGIPRKGLIEGIHPLDPWAHLGVILVVGLTGAMACLFPARKAANLNPMEALRNE